MTAAKLQLHAIIFYVYKGQDEGNHFLKGKLPVPGIVFAGSCGEEPFVVR